MESQRLAEEVSVLLERLDPLRWHGTRTKEAEGLLARVAGRAQGLLDRPEALAPRLRERVHEVHLLAAGFEGRGAGGGQEAWQALRRRLHAAYEGLAQLLRSQSLPVAAVRPTNYTRTAFHVAGGVLALVLVQHVLSPRGAVVAALGVAALAWALEALRRFSPPLNAVLMRMFHRVAHAHEHHGVNSTTWFLTAIPVLVVTVSPLAASVAVMVLALADPAAGIVGRRWGRTRLRASRSLEGSLTFLVTACATAFAVLLAYAPALSWPSAALVAVGAAVPAALAELFSTRLDDNFTVPLAAGIGASLVLMGFGLA